MAKATCSVEGCDRPSQARGLCKTHWARWKRNGAPVLQRAEAPPGVRPGMRWCCACMRIKDEQSDFYRPRGRVLSPCKDCRKAAAKRYREVDLDAARAAARARYVANRDTRLADSYARRKADPERRRRQDRRYRERNRERIRRQQAAWAAANRARVAIAQARYYGKRGQQYVEAVDRDIVFRRDRGICGICGTAVDPRNFHVDHIMPISLGGEHSYANVQVAHPFCNISKSNRVAA